MPYTIVGEPTSWHSSIYDDKTYHYTYPQGLDLRPNSDLHKDIRSRIWQRAHASRLKMSNRFESWREVDKTLTTYVPLKDKERELKEKDPSKPTTIVFPYTYAMLEALLTYLSLAFFQDPIFLYEGTDSSDTIGAMLMELVIRLHCIKTKVPLAIHTALRDSLAYGLGIAAPVWTERYGKIPVRHTNAVESAFGTQTSTQVEMIDSLIFEGNALTNIDPYMWLPDPSVSSVDIQKGEYVGWIERDNFMNLLTKESQPNSGLFNVKYLKGKQNKRSYLAFDQSDRLMKFGGPTNFTLPLLNDTNPVDVIHMYINLIPRDWHLGTGEYPEKWYFELASDDVIIACEPATHNHGMYPVAVASPEFDGYSMTPISRMEVLYGLQHTLDFLFDSHIKNVRKAINDMLIVDPYLVNMKDLEDPRPGGLVRLRRPAWGRGVEKVVQQLTVTDITRTNIADSAYITQWMDRVSGADSSMQGALRQGGPERLTGIEFQGTRGSAISRLQRLAMIISMQFMQDVGTMFAAHTQEYMSKEVFVKIAGRYAEQLRQTFQSDRAKVTPFDLAISYDLTVRDGSIPGNNFSDAWLQMFKIISQSPELLQQFDIVKIFTFIAEQSGAKNVEDFRKTTNAVQPTVMPNEQVASEVQKGNMVPLGDQNA